MKRSCALGEEGLLRPEYICAFVLEKANSRHGSPGEREHGKALPLAQPAIDEFQSLKLSSNLSFACSQSARCKQNG